MGRQPQWNVYDMGLPINLPHANIQLAANAQLTIAFAITVYLIVVICTVLILAKFNDRKLAKMRKELIELKDQAMKQRIETILECERMIIDARKEASQIIEYQKREGTE